MRSDQTPRPFLPPEDYTSELIDALTALLEHSAKVNELFYVSGKRKDMIEHMGKQKDILRTARAAIAKAKGE